MTWLWLIAIAAAAFIGGMIALAVYLIVRVLAFFEDR